MTTFLKYSFVFYYLCIVINYTSYGQEVGKPFFKNYLAGEYNAGTQNWSVAQDNRGIIYIGNDEGVLQYDGSYWKKIVIANMSNVRSLTVDSAGVVYVGGHSEFGFLRPDLTGNLKYHSLISLLDSAKHDFLDIWCTLSDKNGAYFLAEQYLFHYRQGKIITIEPGAEYFFLAFKVKHEIFVQEIGKGLQILENDSLKLVKAGGLMKYSGPFSILPYKGSNLLVATLRTGLFEYKPVVLDYPDNVSEHYNVFKNDASSFLVDNQLYHGTKLDYNKYAYATTQKGIIVINEEIQILENYNRDNLLQDNAVYYLHHNENRELWAALDNGIAKIETNSPFRFWDEETGYRGTILDITRFNGKLLIATVNGVYLLGAAKSTEYAISKFSKIKGIISQSWDFMEFNYEKEKHLYVNSDDGIYRIDNDSAYRASEITSCYASIQSSFKKEKVYVALNDGLGILTYKNGEFEFENFKEDELHKEIRSLAEDSLGNIWVSANFNGIYKISFNKNDTLIAKYDSLHGLPSLKEILIFNYDNVLRFGTKNGLYYYDYHADRFFPDFTFGETYASNSKNIKTLIRDSNGNYLINGADRFIKISENKYERDSISFRRLPANFLEASFADKNNWYWIGGSNGLFRFNPNINKNYNIQKTINTLVRKVVVGKDSTIFNGYYHVVTRDTLNNLPIAFLNEQPESFVPEIDFKTGSITFYYSLPFYEDEKSNEYNYLLKGFDKNWSGWTRETKKEYTNLSEGSYTFHVKGKSIYGLESQTASYSFEILPPWYRSWYAFLSYLALLVLFITIIIRIRTARLKHEKQKLESLVLERTAEIHAQKEELESQAEWLQNANQNMLEQKHEILFQSERLKRTNEELEKLSIIARETDNAVSVMDSKGNFEWINAGFERLYGYNLKQLIKEDKRNIIGTHAGITSKDIANVWYGDKKTMIYESENKTRTGSKIWTQTTLTPILDKKKNVKKLVAIETDITVLKEAEAQIQKQRDELERANATKDTFFSIIAHDLRSPFSSFVSLTNLMVENIEDFSNAEIEKYLGEIRNTSQNTFNLIENLLDWARSQKGEISFKPKGIDAAILINENIELLKENAQQKKIHLISKVKKETKIFADENMLQTIFRNLISNAIKFTGEEGEIIVSSKSPENFIEFAVKDNGVGIVKENIGDIFRIDKRHSTLGTRREKGTGLGLILCKEFIERNGGKIRVESKKDEGTIFFFTLPKQKIAQTLLLSALLNVWAGMLGMLI